MGYVAELDGHCHYMYAQRLEGNAPTVLDDQLSFEAFAIMCDVVAQLALGTVNDTVFQSCDGYLKLYKRLRITCGTLVHCLHV